MGLIKCSKCKKEFEDNLNRCPHCNYPIENHGNTQRIEEILNELDKIFETEKKSLGIEDNNNEKEILDDNTNKDTLDKTESVDKIDNDIKKKPKKEKKKMTTLIKNLINKPIFKKIIKILLIIIAVTLVISVIIKLIISAINKKNYKEAMYYCRATSSTAEVNAVAPGKTTVKIIKAHKKENNNGLCLFSQLSAKRNQKKFKFNCGETEDTITYTYSGTVGKAIKQLKEDNYECILREKSKSEHLEELKNNLWCESNKNTKTYYYYKFDNDKAYQYYQFNHEETAPAELKYYLNGDKLTIVINDQFDDVYNYENNKFNLENNSDEYYLEPCEEPITFDKVKLNYYAKINGKRVYTKFNYIGKYEYTFSKYECSNGNSGEWNDYIWHFVPKSNIESVCDIYFDKKNN